MTADTGSESPCLIDRQGNRNRNRNRSSACRYGHTGGGEPVLCGCSPHALPSPKDDSMPSISRRISTALAATAVLSAGLVAGAAGASAKSDLDLGVSSHAVSVGSSVKLSATGDSDDFGGAPMYLCIDERVDHAAWRQQKCTSGGRLELDLRAVRQGALSFRAQLIAFPEPHHRSVDRTSPTLVVQVR